MAIFLNKDILIHYLERGPQDKRCRDALFTLGGCLTNDDVKEEVANIEEDFTKSEWDHYYEFLLRWHGDEVIDGVTKDIAD